VQQFCQCHSTVIAENGDSDPLQIVTTARPSWCGTVVVCQLTLHSAHIKNWSCGALLSQRGRMTLPIVLSAFYLLTAQLQLNWRHHLADVEAISYINVMYAQSWSTVLRCGTHTLLVSLPPGSWSRYKERHVTLWVGIGARLV